MKLHFGQEHVNHVSWHSFIYFINFFRKSLHPLHVTYFLIVHEIGNTLCVLLVLHIRDPLVFGEEMLVLQAFFFYIEVVHILMLIWIEFLFFISLQMLKTVHNQLYYGQEIQGGSSNNPPIKSISIFLIVHTVGMLCVMISIIQLGSYT